MIDFSCRNSGCRSPHVKHAARGLCRTCWSKFHKTGSLDELFPKVDRPSASSRMRPGRTMSQVRDDRYEAWIRKGDRSGFRLPAEEPIRWLLELRDSMGLRDASWGDGAAERLAAHLGINREVVNRLLARRASFAQDFIVERIALATNNMRAYYALRPAEGQPGWSDRGDWCEGCGTFHHPHHADGLCEECWTHRDDPDFETRDIRVTRKVRAEQMGGHDYELATAG